MVGPSVIVLAHTATSYTLGAPREAQLVAEMETLGGCCFITAFGGVLAALKHLGIRRLAYATPYSAEMTARGAQHLEQCGIRVVNSGHLADVRNIYEENSERAYAIARQVDRPEAEAIFLSGVGMPTLDALQVLEQDTRKPGDFGRLRHDVACAAQRRRPAHIYGLRTAADRLILKRRSASGGRTEKAAAYSITTASWPIS
jgi:maleate cis-trans isomerase